MRQFIGNPYDVELESDEDLVELQELDENAAVSFAQGLQRPL